MQFSFALLFALFVAIESGCGAYDFVDQAFDTAGERPITAELGDGCIYAAQCKFYDCAGIANGGAVLLTAPNVKLSPRWLIASTASDTFSPWDRLGRH